MRADMSKVIVERPRWGSRGNTSVRIHRRHTNDPRGFDDAPTHESSRRHYAVRKSLNENLSPLLRFLRAHVGRPWNNVYGELRAGLRLDKATHLHIVQHLADFVCTTTWNNPQGALLGHARFGGPVALSPSWRRTLYVDSAGVLRMLPLQRRPRRHLGVRRNDVVVGDEAAVCKAGIWYALDLVPLDDTLPWGRRRVVINAFTRNHDVVVGPWDVIFGRSTSDILGRDAVAVYGRSDVYAAATGLQLGKRALDRLGLRGRTAEAPTTNHERRH
jgi:hypothetical protein